MTLAIQNSKHLIDTAAMRGSRSQSHETQAAESDAHTATAALCKSVSEVSDQTASVTNELSTSDHKIRELSETATSVVFGMMIAWRNSFRNEEHSSS